MSKNSLIRNVFIITFALAVIFPLVNIYIFFPSLTDVFVLNAEEEALRIGNHLSGMLLKTSDRLNRDSVSNNQALNKYQDLLNDFQLMKLKIFNPSGEVLFSTSPEDIGEMNKHDYFHSIVTGGKPYTKVAKKDTPSLEGQIVTVDVVETYVPIMRNKKFIGAFEIYYDITSRNEKLQNFIVFTSTVTLTLIAGFLAAFVFVVARGDNKTGEATMEGLPVLLGSPFYLLIFMTLSLFATETVVMLILSAFPRLGVLNEAFLDSALLVMFISPMLYFFMLRPLLIHISELKHAKKQISYMSFHDELTNLPNRALFHDRLKQALLHAERYERKVGLLFIDLDNFKRVNDTFEHRGGDSLLKDIAGRLISNLRLSDSLSHSVGEETSPTIARLGGDEFSILLSEISSSQDSAKVAERIKRIFSKPFSINNQQIFITTSMGIALFPSDGKDVDSLIRNAHAAMYHAKEQGKNNYQFYNTSLNERACHRLLMENDLRRALDNEEFQLYYQPRMNVQSGEIASVEALIRWIKPDGSIVPPMDFIPLAEESGLIIPLGAWVLKKACTTRKAWQQRGMPDISVSVNISGHQFRNSAFRETVADILKETGLAPGLLELEITESIMMKGGDFTVDVLRKMKDLGVKLAMDDFGTGYSSFSYLKRFPLDIIKIDKSFVKDVTVSKDTEAIVEAIIAMAHRLKLHIVAEGVEQEDQLEFLRKQGCDEIQGYLLTPPIPPEKLWTYITEKYDKAAFRYSVSL